MLDLWTVKRRRNRENIPPSRRTGAVRGPRGSIQVTGRVTRERASRLPPLTPIGWACASGIPGDACCRDTNRVRPNSLLSEGPSPGELGYPFGSHGAVGR
jgi:hypothetical protein